MFLVVRVRKEMTKYCAFTSAVTKRTCCEERKRHVDDGAGNNRGGCSIPRDSVFIEATGRSRFWPSRCKEPRKMMSVEYGQIVPLTGVYGAEKMVSSECIGVCDWSREDVP
ncbi:hypothetical protein Hamer_G027700 [Homarus americanus]|uniref:Uncharacterized protein n=1 Tax=Homarus americanus TaxID=6706 RepID=A0A8J5MT50_HOMAM|nr:hypothetical protein Hamer_G027700 [Homarus americanus]